MTEAMQHTNRLVNETSPYLRQHAHNPVDWYPWGDEAFEKARLEDKPVFLSIGYSTCHWCHVMEHESFADEDIAEYLRAHFVSIKLDREERPDLDDIYMTGVQIISGQGGWPMSNFLTAEGKPFFAGTYFPPDSFRNILEQLKNAWENKRDEVMVQADKISNSITQYTSAKGEMQELLGDLEATAAIALRRNLDSHHGGFSDAPKFPNESHLLLILSDLQRNGNEASKDAAELSLNKMYQGGIYDQIAGGFHRYTVDSAWLVPHFEKMLYNQAQLIRVYSQAYQQMGIPAYRRIVEQTIAYLIRDMQDESGLFYTATDADSEGVEGKFFVWSKGELAGVLSSADLELVTDLYKVSTEGNFEGRNILNLQESLEETAMRKNMDLSDLISKLDAIHLDLYQSREKRIHPLRDEKIITSWNAMLITSLAIASEDLSHSEYLKLAEQSAERLWKLALQEKQLWRISFQGKVSIPANQEDYAYFSEALLTLHLHTGNEKWLSRGRDLIKQMISLFWDEKQGGFYLSLASDAGPLITRPKSPMDGAMPSGNSIALSALVSLFEATGDMQVELRINKLIAVFGSAIVATPSAFSTMIIGIERKRLGSMSGIRFCAEGKIRLRVNRRGNLTSVSLDIAEGWHINNHIMNDEPDEIRIKTEIKTDAGTNFNVHYPSQKGSYENQVQFLVEGSPTEIEITFQACNDSICLAPETIFLIVPGGSF
ncbi:MAG: DUF255 domain-containing protein [Pseudomonadales bacterium]|nr:DUF255 domain-containing protein [Pseudomonadales bacterium]